MCELVFGTTAEAGSPCVRDRECNLDEGLSCLKTNLMPCDQGQCLEPSFLDAGQDCGFFGAVCPEGYFCTLDGNACVPLAKKTEACSSSCSFRIPCEPQLQCDENPDGGSWCQDKLVNGTVCLTDSDCAGGLCVTDVMGPGTGSTCTDEHEYYEQDPDCVAFGKN
jgi:hypothetical protein